jgi:hypothetical protein
MQQIEGVSRVHDGFGPATFRRTGRNGIGFPEADDDDEE